MQRPRAPPAPGARPSPARRAPPPRADPAGLDLSSLLDSLDAPEIGADLAAFQAEEGAVFGEEGVPVTFGNDGYALEALEGGVALIDRSHWGRLRLSGPDRLTFLHSQTTADLASLAPGTGADTVFTTPQGRCVDLATVYAQREGALVIVSPGMAAPIKERIEKHIFGGDQVAVSDIGDATAMFSVLGPESDAVMRELAAGDIVGAAPGTHAVFSFGGKPVIAAAGGGLPGPGYTLLVEETAAADLWAAISGRGATPMGTRAWEIGRVLAGRPAPGAELTAEYNPLEAGLYGAVSLNKGCYMGQETLAKVHAQGALRRELWGMELEAPSEAGAALWASAAARDAGERAAGVITTFVDTVQRKHVALAYLRCRDGGGQRVALEGTAVVTADGVAGRVVALRAARRTFPEGAAPVEKGAARGPAPGEAEAAAEAARREEKMAALQAQLAAWQAQQAEQQQ